MKKETPEEIQKLLYTVFEHYDREDMDVRYRQLRTWRQLKLLWEGFTRTWYSEVAHDWRIFEQDNDDNQQGYYDKPINVFRAYLESIIAALSVTVPPVKCYPDDADNNLDLDTAKSGDKISNLLYRHNDVPLLWLHALFIFCTEGMIAARVYPHRDKKYGTYEKKEYDEVEETIQTMTCPECGMEFNDEMVNPQISQLMDQQKDVFNPGPEDVPVQDIVQGVGEYCPQCMQEVIPILSEQSFPITRLTGVTQEPKTRINMEAYGGLYVKVPNYARTQSDCPYLIFEREINYVKAIEDYAELDGTKLKKDIKTKYSAESITDPYEEFSRLSPQYNGEYPRDVVTVKTAWLRPMAFNYLDDDDCEKLKELYPNGVEVTYVGDLFACAKNSDLDDNWTLSYNPMSDYLHHDPLGLLLVSIQEITNDLISLVLQTIEHGIPQTFADPEVVNFDAYRQLEATPGGLYEAKPKTGRAMGDGFHEVKTATLSGEVLPFSTQLQSLGQLVSGALPSLFGGALEGSETASQYSMSRAQALQRLQNVWKTLTAWWKQIFGKAIPMFIDEMVEDERDVQRTNDGNFINVFIRRAELEGKIGKVELEANENLPITWGQRKEVVMTLLQTGVPEILALLGAPENLPIIKEAIGLEDFFIPGEDDRIKTHDDIKQLLSSEPIMDPMSMNGGPEMPSIQPDPTFDNLELSFDIIRKWVISEAGRQTKVDNPQGYKNVLLYGQLLKFMTMQQQLPPPEGEEGQAPPEKNSNYDREAPIKDEGNVQTV